MLPENLAHCMRVSAEGPNTWTAEQSEEIVRKWHSCLDDHAFEYDSIIVYIIRLKF